MLLFRTVMEVLRDSGEPRRAADVVSEVRQCVPFTDRTKRLILETYDAMADAAARGTTYQSPLSPTAGHGPRHTATTD